MIETYEQMLVNLIITEKLQIRIVVHSSYSYSTEAHGSRIIEDSRSGLLCGARHAHSGCSISTYHCLCSGRYSKEASEHCVNQWKMTTNCIIILFCFVLCQDKNGKN